MEFPRLIYKGDAPPKGELPDPVQTKRVNSQDELDEAIADGWRLKRELSADPVGDEGDDPDAAKAKKPAKAKK